MLYSPECNVDLPYFLEFGSYLIQNPIIHQLWWIYHLKYIFLKYYSTYHKGIKAGILVKF